MKNLLSFLLIMGALASTLSGCGSIYSNYREVEQILAVQTMGLDRGALGVRLTLAAPSTTRPDGSPVSLCGDGQSITSAIQRIRNYSTEEDLFCAHINHIVLGEAAARQGIEGALSYICRSPALRIDTPLYVVRDRTAEELISGVVKGGTGICEVLDAVKSNADERGDSTVFTAAQVIRALARRGSALVCALEYGDSDGMTREAQDSSGGGSKTAVMAGYGILKGDRLCGYIDREDAVGAGFLLNLVGVSDLVLRDRDGGRVTLEITRGGSEITPVWDEEDGSLRGIDIYAQVSADLHEVESAEADQERADYITSQLEAEVSERIRAVLQTSKRLQADFLGLGDQVELADPGRYAGLAEPFDRLLPTLEFRISVSGKLTHTNNLKDV